MSVVKLEDFIFFSISELVRTWESEYFAISVYVRHGGGG